MERINVLSMCVVAIVTISSASCGRDNYLTSPTSLGAGTLSIRVNDWVYVPQGNAFGSEWGPDVWTFRDSVLEVHSSNEMSSAYLSFSIERPSGIGRVPFIRLDYGKGSDAMVRFDTANSYVVVTRFDTLRADTNTVSIVFSGRFRFKGWSASSYEFNGTAGRFDLLYYVR